MGNGIQMSHERRSNPLSKPPPMKHAWTPSCLERRHGNNRVGAGHHLPKQWVLGGRKKCVARPRSNVVYAASDFQTETPPPPAFHARTPCMANWRLWEWVTSFWQLFPNFLPTSSSSILQCHTKLNQSASIATDENRQRIISSTSEESLHFGARSESLHGEQQPIVLITRQAHRCPTY